MGGSHYNPKRHNINRLHTAPKFNPPDLVETSAASTISNNQWRHGAIRKLTSSTIADDDELEAGVINGPLIRQRLQKKKQQNISGQKHAAADPGIKHGGDRIRAGAGRSPSRSHARGAAPDAAAFGARGRRAAKP
jgi:hypothetical protein